MTSFFKNAFPITVTPDVMGQSTFRDLPEKACYNQYKTDIQRLFVCGGSSRYAETFDHTVLSPENIQRLARNILACGFNVTCSVSEDKKTSLVVSLNTHKPSWVGKRSASPGWYASFNSRRIIKQHFQELVDTPVNQDKVDRNTAKRAYAEITNRITTGIRKEPGLGRYQFSLTTTHKCSQHYKKLIMDSLVEELQTKGFQTALLGEDTTTPFIEVWNIKDSGRALHDLQMQSFIEVEKEANLILGVKKLEAHD